MADGEITYYYPAETYHQLNSVAFPDHSRKLAGADGVIRAFWRSGEQMWDEALNNAIEWISRWIPMYTVWRSEPYYPWYSPVMKPFLAEPDHSTAEPWITQVPRGIVFNSTSTPNDKDKVYKPWAGVTIPVFADRIIVGYGGGDGFSWRGIAAYQEYEDAIEIAFFISETRPGEIVASHKVSEPFRLRTNSYSTRVRGYPYDRPQLQVLKNGVPVGTARKYMYTSGLLMDADTDFETGDLLQIFAPVGKYVGIFHGVCISLYGELL